MQNKRKISLLFFAITGVATIGSLYLSIGLGLIPCKYCWYQRIFMYPLSIISILGIIKNIVYEDVYILFSIFGVGLSGYHSILQRIGSETTCTVSCAEIIYTVGVFSIPNLSFIAFTLTLLVGFYSKYNKHGIYY